LIDQPDATRTALSHARAGGGDEGAIVASRVEGRAIESIALDMTGSTVMACRRKSCTSNDFDLGCDHRAWREKHHLASLDGMASE
jgi:hypothetical protein